MIRASLEKDPKDVATMFDDVAKRYDLTNDVLSLGQDRAWRTAVVEAVDAQTGERLGVVQPEPVRESIEPLQFTHNGQPATIDEDAAAATVGGVLADDDLVADLLA